MVTKNAAAPASTSHIRVRLAACHLYDTERALRDARATSTRGSPLPATDCTTHSRNHLAAFADCDAKSFPEVPPPRTGRKPSRSPADDSTKEQHLMTTSLTAWPSTRDVSPPTDHLYRSATWLLGRHPRLALLAARIRGVVVIEDGEVAVDLDHLADVLSAARPYTAAWEDYEYRHRPPEGDDEYETWRRPGQKLTASP
jgi:hypothetical protein